jgi:hypothetical protein
MQRVLLCIAFTCANFVSRSALRIFTKIIDSHDSWKYLADSPMTVAEHAVVTFFAHTLRFCTKIIVM